MLSFPLVKFLFLTLPQRKPVAVSVSDDDEVVDPEPPRKRTRSQTKAAATAAKGKGKAPAKASSSSTRGRRSKKAATPPPVEEPEREEEKEEEERSSPESEDRDTVPPAFRPLARVRLNWEHYPRDESGERIPYVETEHEAREREHLEFLSKGPTPLYGLNGDMVAMGGPSSDDDDEAALAEQAEEQVSTRSTFAQAYCSCGVSDHDDARLTALMCQSASRPTPVSRVVVVWQTIDVIE